MASVFEALDREWNDAEGWVAARIHGQPAASPQDQPQESHMSTLTEARNLIGRFAHDAGTVLPVLEAAALNPHIDALLEAALAATGAGVPAEVLMGAIDMLRAAEQRHTSTPQPAMVTAATTGATTGDPRIRDDGQHA